MREQNCPKFRQDGGVLAMFCGCHLQASPGPHSMNSAWDRQEGLDAKLSIER